MDDADVGPRVIPWRFWAAAGPRCAAAQQGGRGDVMRGRRMQFVVALSGMIGFGLAGASGAGAVVDKNSSSALKAKLITASSVPTGWVSQPSSSKSSVACLQAINLNSTAAHASFGENGGGEVFAEVLTE